MNHVRDKRICPKELAEELGLHVSTLAKWRANHEGPPFHRLGPRIIYYLPEEVEAWLKRCDATPTNRQAAHGG